MKCYVYATIGPDVYHPCPSNFVDNASEREETAALLGLRAPKGQSLKVDEKEKKETSWLSSGKSGRRTKARG